MHEGDRPEEGQRKEKPRPELKVTDRRLFTADGERRAEVPDEAESEGTVRDSQHVASGASGGQGFERRSLDEPAGVDFTMLINAMAQPALLFLGEIPHPGSGQVSIDLEQARIQIDLLDLLRVKCRGNLSFPEEDLLERVLYELRMRYVARTGQKT